MIHFLCPFIIFTSISNQLPYGAIFGVSLGEEYLEQIEKLRIDREEIEKIALLGEISSDEEIRELDRKLIDFY